MIEVRRYTTDQAEAWNRFVAQSKNGTFLFDRRYMDYHADRFSDHSLMVYEFRDPLACLSENNRLLALLPANERDGILYSHQGLTYGGLITDQRATADKVCDIFRIINDYLREQGFRKVVYKPTPAIYHQMAADEDLYAMFVECRAHLTSRNASSCLRLDRQTRFAESRRSGCRKATAARLTVSESEDLKAFWEILTSNLQEKYAAAPVHTVEEMQLLRSRFPEQIRLFTVSDPVGQLLGGTLLYLTPQTVHTQYISASPEGKRKGALDLLFDTLIHHTHFPQTYFDFGTSALDDSCQLNFPLFFQKQGFGARTVCYDRYEWNL